MTLIGVIYKKNYFKGNNLDNGANCKQYWKARYFQSYEKICDTCTLGCHLSEAH